MSKLDKVLVEALLFNKKTPPAKKNYDITLKQFIKFKKEFDDFQKMLEDDKTFTKLKGDKKKQDELSFWQKSVLLHIGAIAYLSTLALLWKTVFH